jgi:hypothetical protein
MSVILTITSVFYFVSFAAIPWIDFFAPSFWGAICSYVLCAAMILLDHLTSDFTQKNYVVLQKNGYSMTSIYLSYLQTIFIPFSIIWAIIKLLCNDMRIEFSVPTLLLVVINLIATDAAFAVAHKYFLHHWFPQLHFMHHCCVYCSISSAFTFDFLDLALEFTPPTMTAVATHFIHYDKLTTFLSLNIIVLW